MERCSFINGLRKISNFHFKVLKAKLSGAETITLAYRVTLRERSYFKKSTTVQSQFNQTHLF